MTSNKLYLHYSENLHAEMAQTKELIRKLNKKLGSIKYGIDLITNPIPDAKDSRGITSTGIMATGQDGIHLTLLSPETNVSGITNEFIMKSRQNDQQSLFLIKRDVNKTIILKTNENDMPASTGKTSNGNEPIAAETESQDTNMESSSHICGFGNADTLRTYVLLLLEPYLCQITGTDVIRYRDNAIYAWDMPVACLDNVPFIANNKGIMEARKRMTSLVEKIAGDLLIHEKAKLSLTETTADIDHDPKAKDTQAAYVRTLAKENSAAYRLQTDIYSRTLLHDKTTKELTFLLHAALRFMETGGTPMTAQMAMAAMAFEEGDTERAYAYLDNEREAPTGEKDPQAHILLMSGMILKAAIRMACTSVPIEKREADTRAIYEKAMTMVRKPDETYFIRLMADYSRFLSKHSENASELTMIANAAELLKSTTQSEAADITAIYGNIAAASNAMGEHLATVKYCKRAITTRKEIMGEEHPATASSYHAMARYIIPLGCIDKALEFLNKAADIQEKVFGIQHPVTAATYDDLGSCYHMQGNDQKALQYYRRTLEIRERTLGNDHPDTAATHINTGFVFYNRKDYDKALLSFQKAMEIRERTLGEMHPDTAAVYGHVADTYYNMGEYSQAAEHYSRQLLSHETVLEARHPDTASAYSNVGNCLLLKDDFELAAECYKKALEIRMRTLGEMHPSTASSYYDLGTAHACLNDYPKALEFFMKSLEIRQEVLKAEHTDTCSSLWKVALIYFRMRDFRSSIKYLKRTVRQRKKLLGPNHPQIADIYSHLGYAYFHLMENGRAMDYFGKAVEIHEKTLGPDHPKYKSSCFFYAKLLNINEMGGKAEAKQRKMLDPHFFSSKIHPNCHNRQFQGTKICDKKSQTTHQKT